MLKARPQLNGNTRRDFGDAYAAITEAHKALSAARVLILENVINGRNYQHLPPDEAEACAREDRRRVQEDFVAANILLAHIASEIEDACNAHENPEAGQ